MKTEMPHPKGWSPGSLGRSRQRPPPRALTPTSTRLGSPSAEWISAPHSRPCSIFVGVSIAVTEHMDQKQSGEESVSVTSQTAVHS